MTIIAGVTVPGPGIVLAQDGSAGMRAYGDPGKATPPAQVFDKIYALSGRLPLIAGFAGALGAYQTRPTRVSHTVPELVARVARRFDGEDSTIAEWALGQVYTVEAAARLLAAEIAETFVPLWVRGCSWHGLIAWVAGFDGGSRRPRIFYAKVVPVDGLAEFGLMQSPGAFVSPHAHAAEAEMRRIVTREPRSIEHGAELLRRIVQRQIDHTTKYPDPDLDAAGPVRAMVVTPDGPGQWLDPEPAAPVALSAAEADAVGATRRVEIAPGAWVEITRTS